ncbi:hypothetical protein SAMN05444156_2483 [Verrucomicrobium sp. GAS474]|uniref:hypothetical protein n=1 Tax=Verrucomicrobium sp. GAS474 TaxID=1882831 RepID=UPI00087D35F3|nr:hypothetical protein [Verrucomicrobium sp. GAS474]SDU18674.1 hypothetical protein SAMN05444156_2483 [Verrucomicrobium sp. GAS474]
MKISAGLWIDHRKAVIVVVSTHSDEIIEIRSNVDKQLGRYDGVRSTTRYSQEVPADDSQEREFEGQLNQFYDEVIAALRTAEFVLIFGPGEAKGELKKRLEKGRHEIGIITVETDDKMTDHQIAAKVREHFHK